MRQLLVVSGLTLICSACVQPPPPIPDPVFSQVTEHAASDNPACRDYTATATVNGKQQEIVGRACQQADGTWKVAEGPPGQPSAFQTMYWPPVGYAYAPYYPYASYYPYYDPWFYGPPIGLSFGGGFVFVDRLHHFHHFHREFARDGFRNDRFGHSGFEHGGFGHGGFGHGGGMHG